MKKILWLSLLSAQAYSADISCVLNDGTGARACAKQPSCFTVVENEPKQVSLCDKKYSVSAEHYVDTFLIRIIDRKTRNDIVRTTRDAKDLGSLILTMEKPKVSVSCFKEAPKECLEPVKKP